MPKYPYDQQSDFGQQRNGGREQRPDLVDPVVDFQVAVVCRAETRRLALFLRERLDYTYAGNGIGQHARHLGPDPIDFFESGAQSVAY